MRVTSGIPRATAAVGTMVDQELDELKREFLSEALEKADEMQSTFDDGQSRESLDRLAYLAHQLKGSGGSYGYQTISTGAAEIEKAVEALVTQNGKSNVTQEQIRRYVADLRTEIETAFRELS